MKIFVYSVIIITIYLAISVGFTKIFKIVNNIIHQFKTTAYNASSFIKKFHIQIIALLLTQYLIVFHIIMIKNVSNAKKVFTLKIINA